MALRANLQATATRLIAKFGDEVNNVAIVSTPGLTEYDLPSEAVTLTPVDAVVTGAGKWADGTSILMTDYAVLVSGASALINVGDTLQIDGKPFIVTLRQDILATGVKSAVRYFVRGS